MGDCVALCQGIAQVTNEITFGTSVQPIYFRNPEDPFLSQGFDLVPVEAEELEMSPSEKSKRSLRLSFS